jgi:transposase
MNDTYAKFAALENDDPVTYRYLRILVAFRRAGASIRDIAKCSGESKSTIGRMMPLIDYLAKQPVPDGTEQPQKPQENAA